MAGGGSVKVTGVFAGTVAGCSAALGPLTAAVGQATTYQFVGPEEYMTATMIEAGCEGKPVAQCATPVAVAVRGEVLLRGRTNPRAVGQRGRVGSVDTAHDRCLVPAVGSCSTAMEG